MSIQIKNIELINETFAGYINKKIKNEVFEKKLGTLISHISVNGKQKNFDVKIINNNNKEPFFGMRIFPVFENMDRILKFTVVDKMSFKDLYETWKLIDKWCLEIDNNVFNRYEINFTPRELTAMIIHEIGHTIYSDKVLERFYRAYKESYIHMKNVDKKSIRFLYILYTIPLSLSCVLRNWVTGDNEIKVEYFSDAILKDIGYTSDLISAINKIIRSYGNTSLNDQNQHQKISQSIKWCGLNVNDLVHRKNKMKDELFYQAMKTNSSYMKATIFKIINDLGIKLRENYTGAVVECTLDIIESPNFISKYSSFYDIKTFGILENLILNTQQSAESDIAMEAFKAKQNKKILPPSQYDVDALYVEIDRITNHHDRIYVLDLIYNKIEELDNFNELMERDSNLKRKYKDTVDNMKIQLSDLRKNVLAKRNFDKEYKLFVKYPKGYEG